MNPWLIAVVVMVVVGIPAVFTAGVIVALTFAADANPADSLKSVLGSAGDWVSGLGALSAAVIAIWLAEKQRKDSLPDIKITQDADPYEVAIDIICTGDRSVLVRNVYMRLRSQSGRAYLPPHGVLPLRLEHGDVHCVRIKGGAQYHRLSEALCGHEEQDDLLGLEIVVETSTRDFTVLAEDIVCGVLGGTASVRELHEVDPY